MFPLIRDMVRLNAHEAHMSASWAYIPIIWSHINAYLTHRGPYWPQMGSIRIHIKAVLGPYGFLSGAFLDRYVPIWYYMKPYWCPVNSCWVPSGPLRIHSPTLDPQESMLDRCCVHLNFMLNPILFICTSAGHMSTTYGATLGPYIRMRLGLFKNEATCWMLQIR